jgi:putative ABC transport system permease protein
VGRLVLANLWAKKGRSIGIALAVALAVMTVVTLAAVSNGLKNSATQVLEIGKSDFTVAQKAAPDILASTIDSHQLGEIQATPGAASAIGVLVETQHLNAANPLFIEIGIRPADLRRFGVTAVAGRPYAADASHEVMLGWRAAQNWGLRVGSIFHANGTWNRVVGIYSTGISYGDLGAMFPLPAVQAYNRVPGALTLIFVKVAPGASPAKVAASIDYHQPELTTIRTAQQFGRADRNLVFLEAAATGSTVLAIVIGAIIVGNTMLLSLFERTREFGVLRAVGWSRSRLVGLVGGEVIVLAIVGSVLGVGLSFAAAALLEALPPLRGVLHSDFTNTGFFRGLETGLGMAVLGALYPALRAANLTPLRALTHE